MIAGARREVGRRPNSARAHTTLGIALLNAGQLESAEAEFEAALRLQPTQYVAATNLARIKVQAGKYDEAERLYNDLQQHYPTNATPFLSLAFIAMKRQDFVNAERLLKEAIRLGHRAVTARYHLAMVLLRLGKTREAIAFLRSAARDEVRAPSIYEGLGAAYAVKGDFGRAAVAFKTALSLAPNSANAVRGLARVLLELKQSDESIDLLQEYLERTPHDNTARELLARAYGDQEQYRSAVAQLTTIFAQVDSSESQDLELKARLSNNIGAFLLNDGDTKQAHQWLLRSVAYAPSPVAYQNLTRVYLKTAELTKAAVTARLIRTRFPHDPIGVELMAICLRRVGSYDAAITEIKRFLDSDNTPTPGLYSELGCLLADAKRDYDSALNVLRQGFERFKKEPLLANNLAYAYLMLGNAQKARSTLESFKDTAVDEAQVCVTATWGLLHFVEGDIEGGRQLYRRAEKLAQQHGDRELARTVVQKMYLELARAYLRQRN